MKYFSVHERSGNAGYRLAGLAFFLVVLTAACTEDSTPDEETALLETVDVGRIYRFVDELPLDDGNIPQIVVNNDTRMAVVGTPVDDSHGFERRQYRSRRLTLPDDLRLLTSLGISHGEDVSGEVTARFSIELEAGGDAVAVLDPTEVGVSEGWQEVAVDLSAYAGQSVRFLFSSETQAGTPAWGNPRLATGVAEESQRPNVLLISLDTLRADHLGIYEYERETSPGIDAFSGDSVVFDLAVSPSSWTLPAHASLFTGVSPSEHGAISMGAPVFVGKTLAELGYDAGYRTGALTDGGFVEAARGFGQGFSTYVSDRKRAAHRFASALDWIDAADDTPFLLFVHTYEVHSPYRPPVEYAERFVPEGADAEAVISEIDVLEKGQELRAEHRDAVVDLYDAEIAYTDEVLAGFFNALQDRNQWENTMVIVFSDHGEQFWEHGQYGHGVSLYEEEIRIPLIVKPAGENYSPGRRSELVSLTDVYATVADAMGWPHENRPSSRSFRSLLESTTDGSRQREYVISEVGMRVRTWDPIPPIPRQLSYRAPDWKLITDEASERMRFYNLEADPLETQDTLSDASAHVHSQVDAFRRYVNETAANLLSKERRPPPVLSTEQQEELEALGYFQ